MKVTIREATLLDYEALCDLFAEVDRAHREALPDLFRETDGPSRDFVYIRALITDRDHGVLVAENKESARRPAPLLGCLIIVARESPDVPILVPIRYAMVDTLVVAEAYRGTGVGRQLMRSAEDWALGKGIDRIELNVFEFNEGARIFYESLGYTTLSRRMAKQL
ncbi:MAG: GNAT family N-acetyltransferase [Anaerolineae bacterium]|nr:GNAT family N-acetyltransferase [Anaerolineae bacterium]